ncbi:10880_t:CDS:1, partial [Gigaspora rosea]
NPRKQLYITTAEDQIILVIFYQNKADITKDTKHHQTNKTNDNPLLIKATAMTLIGVMPMTKSTTYNTNNEICNPTMMELTPTTQLTKFTT